MAVVTVKLLPEHLTREFFMTRFNTAFNLVNYANTHKNEYEAVATWATGDSPEEAAEEAFDLTNNPSRQALRDQLYGRHRSVSVGDIVEVVTHDGTKEFICDSFGWKELV